MKRAIWILQCSVCILNGGINVAIALINDLRTEVIEAVSLNLLNIMFNVVVNGGL